MSINKLNHNIFRLVNDEMTSQEELHSFVFSKNEMIRASIALNKNASRKSLKTLQCDQSESVLINLKSRYQNIPSSKTIKFRLISVNDAEFIYKLRVDEKYNKYISKISDDIHEQVKFIEMYKNDEAVAEQFYFVIERLDGIRCGSVRLYNFKDDSFEWGSWILDENKTRYAAIETSILIYKYAFEVLGFEKSNFEVNKQNSNVVKFHKRTGAKVIGEDQTNYYFEISKDAAFDFIDDCSVRILSTVGC